MSSPVQEKFNALPRMVRKLLARGIGEAVAEGLLEGVLELDQDARGVLVRLPPDALQRLVSLGDEG